MLVRLCKTIPLFTLLGLVGPTVRMAVPTWQNPIGAFVYDLTWFMWPTQAIAVIEVNVGRLSAFLAATGANVLFFLILGVLLGLFGGTRAGTWAFRALLVGLLVYWALFGAGYNPAFVNYGALCIALTLYLGPVWLAQERGWLEARSGRGCLTMSCRSGRGRASHGASPLNSVFDGQVAPYSGAAERTDEAWP